MREVASSCGGVSCRACLYRHVTHSLSNIRTDTYTHTHRHVTHSSPTHTDTCTHTHTDTCTHSLSTNTRTDTCTHTCTYYSSVPQHELVNLSFAPELVDFSACRGVHSRLSGLHTVNIIFNCMGFSGFWSVSFIVMITWRSSVHI